MNKPQRSVFPGEMRISLEWDEETKIAITRQSNRLILQVFQDSCFICGNDENIVLIRGKHICRRCIAEAAEK